jgi:hypothetical protein
MGPESAVLKACREYLILRGHFVYRANNGGWYDKHGRFIRAHEIKGVPDLEGCTKDGKFLGVECKSKAGKQTPEQKAFGEAVARRGGVYVVARSVEDLEREGL